MKMIVWIATCGELHLSWGKDERGKISAQQYLSKKQGKERLRCIDDNEEALVWRLRMIQAAKEKIVLSTFDLRADESGMDVMAALYMAAERGVQVQILVDGIYQILYLRDSALFQALGAHENVEVRFYNLPNAKNIWRLNYRMHDKYLMIDEKMYLLGGRNTNDIFLGDYQKGKNVDRELLVYGTGEKAGDSFLQLQNYFDTIWNEKCVVHQKIDSKNQWEKEYQIFEKRYSKLAVKYELKDSYDRWYTDTIPANKITLIDNGTKAGRKEPLILERIEHLMEKGEDIWIQTPYAICDNAMYDVLENANSSAKVRMILNAVEKGSNPWGCTDYLNNKEKILKTGTTVYELMNKHAVHTKTILIDDRLSVVGSYNYDMRSAYLDTELMLVVDCKELNTYIRKMCISYTEKSIEVLPDGTETAGAAYQPKELSEEKEKFYKILKIVIRPFRHLL